MLFLCYWLPVIVVDNRLGCCWQKNAEDVNECILSVWHWRRAINHAVCHCQQFKTTEHVCRLRVCCRCRRLWHDVGLDVVGDTTWWHGCQVTGWQVDTEHVGGGTDVWPITYHRWCRQLYARFGNCQHSLSDVSSRGLVVTKITTSTTAFAAANTLSFHLTFFFSGSYSVSSWGP